MVVAWFGILYLMAEVETCKKIHGMFQKGGWLFTYQGLGYRISNHQKVATTIWKEGLWDWFIYNRSRALLVLSNWVK